MLVGAGLLGAGILGLTLEEILATYTVRTSKSADLTEDVVDSITLSATSLFRAAPATIIVSNLDDTGVITFTLDGTTPTDEGDDMYFVGPGEHLSVPRPVRGDVVLQLISPVACPYWVRVV